MPYTDTYINYGNISSARWQDTPYDFGMNLVEMVSEFC